MWTRALEAALPTRLGLPFRRVVAASWVSNLGDGLSLAAAPLLVASQTHSPALVALAPLLQKAPWLILGLPAGAIADRVDRRMLLVLANLARAAMLSVLVAFLAFDRASIALVLGVVFAFGVAEVFADTTASTLTPMLVQRRDLGLANARLMAGRVTLNDFVGPPLGAMLFTVGALWPFAAQMLLVLFAAVLVLRLRLPRVPELEDREPSHIRHDVMDGLRWLRHNAPVRTLTLVIVLFNVTWGAAWAVLVLYSTDTLGMSEVGYGLMTTAGAVGGLIGILTYGWWERHLSLGVLMKGCLSAECVMHLLFALNPWQAGAWALMFGFGMYAFVWGSLSSAVRQRAVPQHLQGRVASVYLVGVFAGMVVGNGIGGLLAEVWGTRAPFWFAFVGSVLILAGLWRQLATIVHADAEHD